MPATLIAISFVHLRRELAVAVKERPLPASVRAADIERGDGRVKQPAVMFVAVQRAGLERLAAAVGLARLLAVAERLEAQAFNGLGDEAALEAATRGDVAVAVVKGPAEAVLRGANLHVGEAVGKEPAVVAVAVDGAGLKRLAQAAARAARRRALVDAVGLGGVARRRHEAARHAAPRARRSRRVGGGAGVGVNRRAVEERAACRQDGRRRRG